MQASARLSSSAAFRKAIAGVSGAGATTRSCYRTSRGKAAHAAPLPAQEPPPKGLKRITLQERKARIVEFVENYRASNEGKFPSMTNIRQQVGGCHYTVRDVLLEMKYNHEKSQLANPKPPPLQKPAEVAKHPMPEDENRVPESKGILKVSVRPMAKDDAEVAQRQGAVEVIEHSLPKDVGKVDQLQGTKSESFNEDLTGKPDHGNRQKELKANKFDLKNSEKPLDANASNASDESGSDVANEAKTHAREDNPKLEESVNTGLLGSLRSFAYGIRNLWKNM